MISSITILGDWANAAVAKLAAAIAINNIVFIVTSFLLMHLSANGIE